MSPQIMNLYQGLFSQQRLMWGAVFLVGSVLIFFANAPVIPVIVGCLSVPALQILRSRLQSRNKSRSRY
jgi:hypothetical protein